MLTKSSAVPLMYVTGASTVTSNLASYFDEYQSMFTVGVSMVTCAGFIASVLWNMRIKYKADRRAEEAHNKAMEPDND